MCSRSGVGRLCHLLTCRETLEPYDRRAEGGLNGSSRFGESARPQPVLVLVDRLSRVSLSEGEPRPVDLVGYRSRRQPSQGSKSHGRYRDSMVPLGPGVLLYACV